MTQKLLIIHQGALGDFILTFPALIALRTVYPHIDVLCQQKLGALAGRLSLVEKDYPLESGAFAPLYGERPDRLDARAAGILRNCERIVLFSYARRLQENIERITRKEVLRIPPRPPQQEKTHVAVFLFNSLVDAGLLKGVEPPGALLQRGSRSRPCRKESRRLLLHPGSGSRKKNWPLKNFIRLAEMFRQKDLQPEFLLGPAEIYLQKKLAALPGPSPPIHALDDLLKVLTLMEDAHGFIGNDSGLSHLAAFIGLPTVAVFGPSDPLRWRPLGPAVAAVYSAVDCSPCHETRKAECLSLDCFRGISPEMVCQTFYGLCAPESIDAQIR